MSEEIDKLKKEFKDLKERFDAIEPNVKKLIEIEKEDREDLITQAKKLTDTIPDSVIEKMTRCDLKQIIAKNKPAAEIPTGEPREDTVKPGETFDAFKKPEDWL